ncbi:hypothetical protein [Ramlibacter sp.]|uniref:hypothetical protein n=1 Tax=Ramlibacter sp. TaxID=1917967 RepID=UPI00184FCAAF|nr:hypothetical protein [Ramlibacter sp.]MBA2676045.1 hypothetical protein [Ramlibacter sp.]
MAIIATPSRRQLTMAILLAVAVAGAVIRSYAPNPSTLRDVGTLLLVMWLPAVGNLVGYLIRKIPRRAPRAVAGFAADAAFTPHLQVQLHALDVPAHTLASLEAHARQCALVVGQQGFTARAELPILQTLQGAQEDAAHPAEVAVAVELLRPAVAVSHLAAGTQFHLLLHTTAVATGTVREVYFQAEMAGGG